MLRGFFKKLILLFCIILGIYSSASARSYIFHNLTTRDGLTDQLVNTIHQDQSGYIWLGTASNVVRYDGVHLFEYPLPGIKNAKKRVQSIESAPDKTLWVCNGEGLFEMKPDETEFHQIFGPEINYGLNSLCYDPKHHCLYAGSYRGLFIYDLEQGSVQRLLCVKNELSRANYINSVYKDESERLWLTTGEGLHCLNLTDNTQYDYFCDENPQQGFRHMQKVGDRIFLGTLDNGLFVFDIAQGTLQKYLNLGCDVIYDLSADANGLLYVGTDGDGVFCIDTHTDSVVQKIDHQSANGISSNSVYSVLSDRQGQLWVGFYQQGLDYSLFQSNQIGIYSASGLDTNGMAVRAFARHGSQNLIGCRDGLYFVDEADGRTCHMGHDQLNCQIVFAILYYHGLYYVGTYGGGLFTFDANTLQLRPFRGCSGHAFDEREIFCITTDAEDNLWIGAGGGAYCFSNDVEVHHFTSGNSALPQGNVYEIYFDSTRRGWICTEQGLSVYDEYTQTVRTDAFPDGFASNQKIRDVYEDSDHNLYFVPDLGDVFVCDLSLQNVRVPAKGTSLEGLVSRFVIEDNSRRLWIGTEKGLYSRDSLDNIRGYNFSHGLPSPVFTLCPPILDENHRLWMGNNMGLLYIDQNQPQPTLSSDSSHFVSGIKVNGQPQQVAMSSLQDGGRISTIASPYALTVLFTEFTYTLPESMNYEYMLEGYDSDWITLDGQSEVTYVGLGWGTWRMKVRNCADLHVEHYVDIIIPMSSVDVFVLALKVLGVIIVVLLIYFLYKRRKEIRQLLSILRHIRRKRSGTAPETPIAADEYTAPLHEANELDDDATVQADELKYKNINMPEEERQRIVEGLTRLMEHDKLYTRQDLKIADVASHLGITPYLLSYIFSQHLRVNYYDYINDYRVAEFKRMVRNADLTRYTLPALAEKCGFSSRASFFRYFKKATGVTPSEYVKNEL